MEYVKGETLSDVIRRRAPVPLTWKISLMERLCDGLDYAHRAGLVHRDIKPANLMVTNEADALKILDFGIARAVGDSGLTEVGTMMGTPNYMSPEQASGKPVDRRSDIFAVGAVIYEMLAYRQAFPGKEWQVVLPAILEKSPEPVTHVDRGLAPRLDTIVGRALARDPVQRYQDLRSLRDDLADFRKQLGIEEQETALPTPVPGAEPTTAPPPRGAKARVDTDRARLSELRKAKVTGHVEAAEEALVSGDMEAAQAAAEEASLLDEEDTQVIRLLEKVHDARDAHLFQTNIAESEARLGDDALTAALRLVDDALELQPESSEARELRQRVLGAVEQRSRARERAQLIDRALGEAREGLDAGNPEKALRAASEALAYEPTHPEALTLKRQALAAAEGRRRREAAERQARQAVEQARREFEEGDHTAAIKRLENLGSAHAIVTDTLAELRLEKSRLEREAAETEPSESERWIATQRTAIDDAVAVEHWDDAAARIRGLQARAPGTPEVAALVERVEQGQVEARRRREVADYLSEARRRQADKDFPGALAMIDAALALAPTDDETQVKAAALRTAIETQSVADERAREEAARALRLARQQRVSDGLGSAEAAIRAGALDDMLTALRDIDREAATATQTIRIQELVKEAKRRQAERVAEADRRRREARLRRQQRVHEMQQRLRTRVTGLIAMSRQAAADTRVRIGAGVVAGTSLALWLLMPTPPPAAAPAPDRPAQASPAPSADAVPEASVESNVPISAGVQGVLGIAVSPLPPPAPAPSGPNQLEQSLSAAVSLASAANFEESFQRLDAFPARNRRVGSARAEVEAGWNAAAREAADGAEALSQSGNYGAAFALLDTVQPEHGFVDGARDEIRRTWAASARCQVRRALELASTGDHEGAVALLETFQPPHELVLATLDELQASPDCPNELPALLEALRALRFASGVATAAPLATCSESYRADIQNEQIRFGAGCGRASATASVPILCDGSSEWSEPYLLRFLLTKSREGWTIGEVAEMESPR